jgi:hypothetical protein
MGDHQPRDHSTRQAAWPCAGDPGVVDMVVEEVANWNESQ